MKRTLFTYLILYALVGLIGWCVVDMVVFLMSENFKGAAYNAVLAIINIWSFSVILRNTNTREV